MTVTTLEYVAAELSRRIESLAPDQAAILDAAAPDRRAAADLVDSMLAPLERLLREQQVAHDVGPFYDSRGLERRWGCTRQAVSKRRAQGRLLGVPTDDGRVLYPTWQFVPGSDLRPVVLPGLPEVLAALGEGFEGDLGRALWLCTPSPRLGGLPAYTHLNEHGPDVVLALARSDAARRD